MPSFAISKFTVLLEPLWVPAVFLLLSTGPLLYIIDYNVLTFHLPVKNKKIFERTGRTGKI